MESIIPSSIPFCFRYFVLLDFLFCQSVITLYRAGYGVCVLRFTTNDIHLAAFKSSLV